MLKVFKDSIAAGVLISIGGSVFLACDSRYVGAVLFTVALLCICFKGYYLFTGKIGYLPEAFCKDTAKSLLVGLFGNILTTFALGLVIRYALPNLGDAANAICLAKLEQTMPQTFLRGVFCGILMYLAVSIYRDNKSPLGIIFCVPVFILSGFEHSIADAFYFGASGIFDLKILLFTALVVLGNAVGGVLLPLVTGSYRANKQ